MLEFLSLTINMQFFLPICPQQTEIGYSIEDRLKLESKSKFYQLED